MLSEGKEGRCLWITIASRFGKVARTDFLRFVQPVHFGLVPFLTSAHLKESEARRFSTSYQAHK